MYSEVPQCYNFQYQSHPTHVYHIQGAKCQKYDSLYRVKNHRFSAWYYKTNFKSNSPKDTTVACTPCPYTPKYLNYKKNYVTNNNKYLFQHANKAAYVCFE